MQETLYDYYTKAYPTDTLGEDIDPDLTFQDLWDWMNEGNNEDIYDYIGVQDSMVREGLFEGLAEKLDCDYDVIYELWLKGPR